MEAKGKTCTKLEKILKWGKNFPHSKRKTESDKSYDESNKAMENHPLLSSISSIGVAAVSPRGVRYSF